MYSGPSRSLGQSCFVFACDAWQTIPTQLRSSLTETNALGFLCAKTHTRLVKSKALSDRLVAPNLVFLHSNELPCPDTSPLLCFETGGKRHLIKSQNEIEN